MAWLYLVVAGLFEIGWPLGLKTGWGADGIQDSVSSMRIVSIAPIVAGLKLA